VKMCFEKGKKLDIRCDICYDSILISNAEISAIVCGHIFHKKCILEWLEKKENCPICRTFCESGHLIKLFPSTTIIEDNLNNIIMKIIQKLSFKKVVLFAVFLFILYHHMDVLIAPKEAAEQFSRRWEQVEEVLFLTTMTGSCVAAPPRPREKQSKKVYKRNIYGILRDITFILFHISLFCALNIIMVYNLIYRYSRCICKIKKSILISIYSILIFSALNMIVHLILSSYN